MAGYINQIAGLGEKLTRVNEAKTQFLLYCIIKNSIIRDYVFTFSQILESVLRQSLHGLMSHFGAAIGARYS